MPIPRLVLAAALLVIATVASAQITIYEHENYGGRSAQLYGPTPDFGGTGLNDRASSMVIGSGTWQFCEHAHFGGRCIVLSRGNYAALSAVGMNDRLSSARPMGGGSPPPAAGPGGGGGRGAQIVLYESPDFRGRSIALDRGASNLDALGMNDRARSAIVYGGTWELCEHGDFRGDCQAFGPGRHPNLGGLSGRASSARLTRHGSPGGGGYPPAWGGRVRAILYEGQNFSGRQYVITQDRLDNLGSGNFNDRASSLRIEQGYWVFCSDASFRGTCRTFGPGDYPNLPYDLSHRISSGRRISDHYPYSQPPNWNRYENQPSAWNYDNPPPGWDAGYGPPR